MKKLLLVALMLVFVFGTSTLAHAALVNLVPDDNKPFGTADMPAGAGKTLLASIVNAPWSGGFITGTLNQWVYRDVADNYLIFAYQVTNGAASKDDIARVTMTDFGGWTTDVAYEALTGTGTLPNIFDRSGSMNQGATIGFDWSPPSNHLGVGKLSPVMWIKTNAQYYAMIGTTQVIDGGIGIVNTYSPTVPEPASMLLLGMGLIGFAGRTVRRKFVA
ncbi:MAG: PEP-CTERM sorting domain-containing protein [Candidatus Omnitrophica bacterium]|nr:PEP-CTERM sorting domain-containing protein [Candidatus Omnitrophota bacterium]